MLPTLIGNHPVIQVAAVLFGPPLMAFLIEIWSRKRKELGKATFRLATFVTVYWYSSPFLLVRSTLLHYEKIHF